MVKEAAKEKRPVRERERWSAFFFCFVVARQRQTTENGDENESATTSATSTSLDGVKATNRRPPCPPPLCGLSPDHYLEPVKTEGTPGFLAASLASLASAAVAASAAAAASVLEGH